MITRRSILFGLIAAPVVVRMGLIMPVRAIDDYAAYDPYENEGWGINWPFVSGERA